MKKNLLILILFFCFTLSAQVECGLTAFWSRVQVYEPGEFIQYYGVQYKALVRNTGAIPDLNNGTWLKIDNCVTNETILDCAGIPDWVSTQIYTAGNQVVRNRGIYQSLYWNSNNPPETNTNNGAYAWVFVGRCESSTVSQCQVTTPSFTFDLTGSPDSAWVSPQVRRVGLCCDVSPTENPPYRCVEFFFTLDEDAIGIIFDIGSGAVPPGALFFQINCVGRYKFGELLCLSGKGPYRLTFCKPGNNPNTYIIKSIGKPKVGPPVTVSDGCTAKLTASGYDLSTVKWTSVPSNPLYESYLSCRSQCDTVTATYQTGAPDSVVYQVSGFPPGGCMQDPVVQEVTVYFVNEKSAYILPIDPMVCYGGVNTQITVYPNGGRPPHRFLWNTGETSQTISVGPGTYSVNVFDNTTCPSTSTSVQVGAYLFPILADAGPDQVLCENTTQVQLAGRVDGALGGRWSGGLGQFLPNDSSLTARYIPTQAEIASGRITLTLTTTGNRACPGDDDQVTIVFDKLPTISLPDTLYSCKNSNSISVSGSFSNASGLTWVSKTGGSILPNATSNPISYVPSNIEFTNGFSIVEAQTIQNNSCPSISDELRIIYYPEIVLDPLKDTVLCLSNNSIALDAKYSSGSTIIWSAGDGVFNPQANVKNPTYLFSSNDKLKAEVQFRVSVSDMNNCQTLRDTMKLTWFDSPTINAGPNQNLCKSVSSANLNASSTFVSQYSWSSSSGGVFVNGNTSNPIYQISSIDTANGFVDLTVTGTSEHGCGTATDVVRLIFHNIPKITLSQDYVICKEVQVLDFTARISNSNQIQWTTNGNGIISTVNATSIKYQVSLLDTNQSSIEIVGSTKNNYCPLVSDRVNITFRDSPQILSVSGLEICEETPVANLLATSSNANAFIWQGGNGSFFPNRNALSPSYYPSPSEVQSGQIALKLKTNNTAYCAEDSVPVLIKIIFTPKVDLGNNVSICADQSSIELSATILNSSSGYWSGGSNDFSPDSSASIVRYFFDQDDYADSLVTLFYTTTDLNACKKVSDNVQIRLFPPLRLEAGPNIRVCELQDSVLLPNVGLADSLVTWNTTGTGSIIKSTIDNELYYLPSVDDKIAGSNLLIVTTKPYKSCNQYSDSIRLDYDNIPQLNLGPDLTVCESNLPVTIQAVGNVGKWSGDGLFGLGVNNNNNNYMPSSVELNEDSAQLIFNTLAFNSCPTVSDTLMIYLLNGPEFKINPPLNQCASVDQIQISGEFENFANVIWKSSGNGALIPNLKGDTLMYEPSVLEQSTNDSLLLRFTVSLTDTNNCQVKNQVVSMYLIPRVFSENVRFETICSSQNSLQLNPQISRLGDVIWKSTGTGDFVSSNIIVSPMYNFSVQDLIQDSLVFILTSKNDLLCEDQTDSLYVYIEPQLVYQPLLDTSICKENISQKFEAIADNYSSFNWSTNGDGFFQVSNSLNTNYFLSNIDTSKTSVEIYLNLQSLGVCPNVIDTAVLSLISPVLFSNGYSYIQCKDLTEFKLDLGLDPSISLTWDILIGSGVLSNSQVSDPIYILDSDDYLLDSLLFGVSSNSPEFCASDYSEIVVRLINAPILNVQDYIICESSPGLEMNISSSNAVSSNWTTNGNGFLIQNDINNTRYEHDIMDSVLTSIQVFVELIGDNSCKVLKDTIQISLHEEPIVNAGLDKVLCLDASSVALLGNIANASNSNWVTNGTGSLIKSGVSNANYFFSAADKNRDSLLFTLSSSPDLYCPIAQDQLIIRFSEPPLVGSNKQVLCSIDGQINLNPKVENVLNYYWSSTTPGVFSPSDRDSSVSFTSSVAGLDSVIIKLVVESCVKDSIEITLFSEANSQLDLPDSLYICEAKSNLIEAQLTNVSQVNWTSNGSGTITINDVKSANYLPSTADLLNKNFKIYAEGVHPKACPSVFDTINISVLEKPKFSFGANKIVCPEYVTVPIQTQMNPIYSTLNWTSTTGGIFLGSSDPKRNVYQINQKDINQKQTTIYIKQAAYRCFEESIDSVLIEFYDSAKVSVGDDLYVCGEDISVRINSTFENSAGVKWSTDGSGIFQDSLSNNTNYYFTSQDVKKQTLRFIASTRGMICSPSRDTMVVHLLPTPTINIGGDLIYCNEIPEIDLKGSVVNGTSVTWYSSGFGDFLNPITDTVNTYKSVQQDTIQGEINIVLTANVNGNCLAADELNVIFEKNPIINLNEPNACVGDIVTISGTPVNVFRPIDQYIWTKNGVVLENKDSILNVINEGEYGIEIYLGKCYAAASTKITFNESPKVPPVKKYPICLELGEAITISSENAQYSTFWYHTNETSMTSKASQIGKYNYQLTNEFGCKVMGEVELYEVCAPRLFAPTIFTPNGDGKSDFMTVAGAYIYSYDLKVFNRWGEVIYWTCNMNEFWDGKYRGELMPEGTYNWIIEYSGQPGYYGEKQIVKGAITLVR